MPFLLSLFSASQTLIDFFQAKIPLEESLSILPFVSKTVEGNQPASYHLRGVVHHVGRTAFSGHYTTCAKRSMPSPLDEDQWVFFDDRVGTIAKDNYVTGNERNQRNCYMAIYELKS